MTDVKCFRFTNLSTNLKFDLVGDIIQKFMHGLLKNTGNTGALRGILKVSSTFDLIRWWKLLDVPGVLIFINYGILVSGRLKKEIR